MRVGVNWDTKRLVRGCFINKWMHILTAVRAPHGAGADQAGAPGGGEEGEGGIK